MSFYSIHNNQSEIIYAQRFKESVLSTMKMEIAEMAKVTSLIKAEILVFISDRKSLIDFFVWKKVNLINGFNH